MRLLVTLLILNYRNLKIEKNCKSSDVMFLKNLPDHFLYAENVSIKFFKKNRYYQSGQLMEKEKSESF